MNSQEIQSYMEANHFHINPRDCIEILNNSPQVMFLGNTYGNYYEIISNDGYNWKFTLKLSRN